MEMRKIVIIDYQLYASIQQSSTDHQWVTYLSGVGDSISLIIM